MPAPRPGSRFGPGTPKRTLGAMTVTTSLATTLSRHRLSVDAGGEASCDLQLRNTSDVVDQFDVDVVGPAAAWARAETPVINLMPGGEATVQVVFAPPRSAEVTAGTVAFAVRVRSRENPGSSAVQEGEVEVAPFAELTAELVPAKRRGRRKAKYKLAVENLGNQPETVSLVPIDTEDMLDIDVRPANLATRPGTVTIVKVRTTPKRRFLRGEPKIHPFQLEVHAGDRDPQMVDGVMIQERLLPKWILPALLAVAAGAVALLVLWFTLVKPSVQSVAKDQAQQQLGAANKAAEDANQAARQANQAAQQATGGGSAGGGSAGGAGGPAGAGGAPGGGLGGAGQPGAQGGGTPVDFRIAAGANVAVNGTFQSFPYTAPDGKAMDLGDMVLQNPRGDTGILRITVGDKVILETGLANYRDLDYHYVNALRVVPNQPVAVAVSCAAPGSGAKQCTPSVSFSGRLLS
jgi:hypothetical protein